MPFISHREFINRCQASGDLIRVQREVDWDLEAGAVTRRSNETGGPACLFERIKDYPDGYRILGGPLATYRRVAIAMGLAADTPVREIYAEHERRRQVPVKPVTLATGPCQEEVHRGKNVDLCRLPAPMVHDGDGGRYMVTWGFAVCRDPDTGWSNWGMYRFMLLDGQHLSGQPTPLSNFAHIFREKYMARNRPMPLAIAIGADPLSCMASTTGYRPDEDEADFAGALHGAPVPLVKCVSNDLLVPADSEIVIEGEVPPDAAGLEGPFGEYPGYRIGGVSPKILFNVLAMTHRRDPILTMCVHGVPTDEGHAGGAIGAALGFKRRMQRAELPVLDVTLPPEGASHIVAVSVSRGGPEVAQAVKEIVTQNRAWHTKIIIVDADVDVFNMNEVIHALAVKCHSWRGITLSEEPGKGNPFTPCYTPEERAVRHGAVALFDCTWPPELPEDLHPQKSSFREIYPPDLQARIIRDWRDYGFRSKL